MTIQQSENYNLFCTINGNRNVNSKKIEKIIDDINKGLNLLPYCPIIVYKSGFDDTLFIIDGQHRFVVSKKLNLPVYYVLAEAFTLQQIALLNSRQDKWTANDFLRAYIKIGIQDYITLSAVVNEYKTGLMLTSTFLMYGKVVNSRELGPAFRDGNFKVNFYDETIALFKLTLKLFEPYRFRADRNLVTAIKEIKEKGLCDFDILQKKLAAAPMMMNQNGTVKDYIYNIERVYNHNNKERKHII